MQSAVVIAQHDLGPCVSCTVPIEGGDPVIHYPEGVIHAGCIRRQAAKVSQAQPQSAGLLWSDEETATVEHAEKTLGVKPILSFDGASALGIDTPRLANQLAKVFELMRDGKYRTLTTIASVCGCLETSASARLRDLRKARFGSHTVISRQVEGVPLVYEYRLVLNEQQKETDGERNAA